MSRFRALVGTYRFVFSDAMRAHLRERYQGEEASVVEERMAAAEREATSAEIEVTSAGEIASRAEGVEFYRAPLRSEEGAIYFDKPTGVRVVLHQPEPDVVLADEPGKPPMRFERV